MPSLRSLPEHGGVLQRGSVPCLSGSDHHQAPVTLGCQDFRFWDISLPTLSPALNPTHSFVTIISKYAQEMDSSARSPLVGVVRCKQGQCLGLKRQLLRWKQVEGSPMGKAGRSTGFGTHSLSIPAVTIWGGGVWGED